MDGVKILKQHILERSWVKRPKDWVVHRT